MKILSKIPKKFFIVLISAICIISMSFFSLFSKAEAKNISNVANEVKGDESRHMYTPDKHQRDAVRIDQDFGDLAYKKATEGKDEKDYQQVRYLSQKPSSTCKGPKDKYIVSNNGVRDDFIYTGEGPYVSSDNDYCTAIQPFVAITHHYVMNYGGEDKETSIGFGVNFDNHVGELLDYNYMRFTLCFCADDGNGWQMTNEMDKECKNENFSIWGLNGGYGFGGRNEPLLGINTETRDQEQCASPNGYAISSSYHDGGASYKNENECPIFHCYDGKTFNCDDKARVDKDYEPFIGKSGGLFIRYVFDED